MAALLMLPWLNGPTFALVVLGSAVTLCLIPGMVPATVVNRDRAELIVIAGLYVAVTALLSLAFRVFGTDQVLGLFLCFAAALILVSSRASIIVVPSQFQGVRSRPRDHASTSAQRSGRAERPHSR